MAFHPYPGVIAAVFNRRAFGPPQGLTPASACPGVDRPASRPRCATNVALFRLAFAAARCPLTSPRSATRWLILQKARRHSARLLRLLGGARFQALFHSPPGVLFTFPHGTGPLSVAGECSALEGGPPCFARGSSCPALLRDRPEAEGASRTGLSPAAAGLPMPFRCHLGFSPRGGASPALDGPTTPGSPRGARFGLARFRSPLLPGSRLISPPPGTEMFQFPGLPPNALWIQALVAGHDPCWVPPFGHPRIEGRLRLPGAYRRLPRPSSASCAKASAARP